MIKHYIIELSIDSTTPISNYLIHKLKNILSNSISNYLSKFYYITNTITINIKSIGEVINEEDKTNSTTTK